MNSDVLLFSIENFGKFPQILKVIFLQQVCVVYYSITVFQECSINSDQLIHIYQFLLRILEISSDSESCFSSANMCCTKYSRTFYELWFIKSCILALIVNFWKIPSDTEKQLFHLMSIWQKLENLVIFFHLAPSIYLDISSKSIFLPESHQCPQHLIIFHQIWWNFANSVLWFNVYCLNTASSFILIKMHWSIVIPKAH